MSLKIILFATEMIIVEILALFTIIYFVIKKKNEQMKIRGYTDPRFYWFIATMITYSILGVFLTVMIWLLIIKIT